MNNLSLIHGDYQSGATLDCIEPVQSRVTKCPMNRSATGYGARIATCYEVKYKGRWRRVYCYIYTNSGTCFIGNSLQDGITVQ